MYQKLLKKFLLIASCIAFVVISFSCDKDNSNNNTSFDKKWLTVYRNITLGNQGNPDIGPFFKPKTGEVIKLGETAGIEEFIGMVFFSTYGNQTYITFPADADEADAYSHEDNPIFVANPAGLDYWLQSKMVNGMITKPSPDITLVDFNALANQLDADRFDFLFRNSNKSFGEPQEFLQYKSNCILDAEAGQVYLAQFNKSVRALVLVKNLVTAKKGSITFDIIIESRKSYENIDITKNIQPDEK